MIFDVWPKVAAIGMFLIGVALAGCGSVRASQDKAQQSDPVAVLCSEQEPGTTNASLHDAVPEGILVELVQNRFRSCRAAATVLAMRGTPRAVSAIRQAIRKEIEAPTPGPVVYGLVAKGVMVLGFSPVARRGGDEAGWLYKAMLEATAIQYWLPGDGAPTKRQRQAASSAAYHFGYALARSGTVASREALVEAFARDSTRPAGMEVFGKVHADRLLEIWTESAAYLGNL